MPEKKTVLIYHPIKPDVIVFIEQWHKKLLGQGYRFVDADSFLNSDSSDKTALMTFDDGYEWRNPDIIEYLRKNKLKALTFVIPMTSDMGKFRYDDHAWAYWRNNSDVYEIGSHTLTHSKVFTAERDGTMISNIDTRIGYGQANPMRDGQNMFVKSYLTAKEWNPLQGRIETDIEYHRRIGSDLWMSKNIIEKNIGRPCRFLAYPWGEYNQIVKMLAEASGYEAAFSVNRSDGDRFSIPRKIIV